MFASEFVRVMSKDDIFQVLFFICDSVLRWFAMFCDMYMSLHVRFLLSDFCFCYVY